MKVESVDLHGLNLEEALDKVRKNLNWCMSHGVAVLDINHGKGHHSSRSFSVLKTEIRKMLKDDESIKANGYKVIYGESNLPVALTYDEGHTLVVSRGWENEYIGGSKQIQKNLDIYSAEGRQKRKNAKNQRAQRKKHHK